MKRSNGYDSRLILRASRRLRAAVKAKATAQNITISEFARRALERAVQESK